MTNGGELQEAAMHARTLFEVLLRVLGMFLLLSALRKMLQAGVGIAYLASIDSLTLDYQWNILYGLIPGIVELAVGLFVISGASRLTAWSYSGNVGQADPLCFGPIEAGDLYRIVSFGIGTVLIVQAAVAGGEAAVGLLMTQQASWSDQTILQCLIVFIIYGLSGLVLTFGSRQIGAWMATLRYDPDTIPAQQFSLRVLLIVITLVGVAFAALQYWRM